MGVNVCRIRPCGELASCHGSFEQRRDQIAFGVDERGLKSCREQRVAVQVGQQAGKSLPGRRSGQQVDDVFSKDAEVAGQRAVIEGRLDRFVVNNKGEHHLGFGRPSAVDGSFANLRRSGDLFDRQRLVALAGEQFVDGLGYGGVDGQ